MSSVLVFTGGEIYGDGIIKLPFIAALRDAFPAKQISWFAEGGTVYATDLASLASPFLNEILIPDKNTSEQLIPDLRPLKNRRFDIIIDTQRNSVRTLMLSRVPHFVFVSAGLWFLLSDRAPPRGVRYPKSMLEQLMMLAALALNRPIKPMPIALAEKWLGIAADLLPAGSVYIALAPGARDRNRCWPLNSFIEVAKVQLEKGRVPVFVLGPMEQDWVGPLREAVPGALFPLQSEAAAPHLSPELTIAIAGRVPVAVANDTGVGHMMAAGGTAMVSLFKNRGKLIKFSPYAERLIAFSPDAFGKALISDIPVSAVCDAVDRLATP